MTILVAGGAGYIGSHVVRELSKKMPVVVYDSLEYGHKAALPKNVPLVKANLADVKKLHNTFKKYSIDAVMHFGGYIVVPESVTNPLKYYENNVVNTLNLITVMKDFNVKKIVFSSSAAVYGKAEKVPILEDSNLQPENPYGETKLMVEQILHACDTAFGLKSVCLRYFNAAGADPSGEIGEAHNPESHLIPIVLEHAMQNKDVTIFGTDYPTKDGSCVRDYIHVNDLASAHILAVKHLLKKGPSKIFNLGSGNGFSVKEIIDTARKVTGIKIKVKYGKRRAGDPPKLVASSKKIMKELGWKPKYSDVEMIIKHAWNWHRTHPNGFKPSN